MRNLSEFTQGANQGFIVVQKGDTLSKIAEDCGGYSQHDKQHIIDVIVEINQIQNPNHIEVGWALEIPSSITIPSYSASFSRMQNGVSFSPSQNQFSPIYSRPQIRDGVFTSFNREMSFKTQEEREYFAALTYLLDLFDNPSMATSSSVISSGFGGLDKIALKFKNSITDLINNYQSYLTGDLTKHYYNEVRRKILQSLKGPAPSEINISTGLGRKARKIMKNQGTASAEKFVRQNAFSGQLKYLNKVSTLVSRGNFVLNAIGLSNVCKNIARAKTSREKNKILFNEVGSQLGGNAGVSIGVAILALTGGVGGFFLGFVVIGASGAALSFGGEKVSRTIFDLGGDQFDIVEILQITKICK